MIAGWSRAYVFMVSSFYAGWWIRGLGVGDIQSLMQVCTSVF
jgi:hypothetical protein